ncbi:MAG: hypothetical protein LBM07_00980 [Culturomica sp.]|jgi:hypothetical protein|nr:hypothetical protein [Culturomica sp.]
MKKLLFILVLLFSSQFLFAQFEEDALRASRIFNGGTARSAAMGGAFGALGGDLSSAIGNPAGIGVFRKSELNFTPMLSFTNTKSAGYGVERTAFQLANLGVVMSFPYNNDEYSNWKSFNFAVNFANTGNYNRTLDQAVSNSVSSLLDVYRDYSQGIVSDNLDPFTTGSAYDTYLLNPVGTEGTEYENVLQTGELVNQFKYIKERGSSGEFAMSFGANYNDKLYVGATMGLTEFEYKMRASYSEYASETSDLDHFNKYENQEIIGFGFNMKFGVIYRPIPQIRLGAAIHTPSWYTLNYDYRTEMESYFFKTDQEVGRDKLQYTTPVYNDNRDVNLRTPWRAILSAATVIGNWGILSFDYEYVDYSSAKFGESSDYASFHEQNSNIDALYSSAHNFRAGAEVRLGNIVSLRAGYSFEGTPYKTDGWSFVNSISGGEKINSLSGGIGLNFGMFYCDAALTHSSSKDTTVFYYVPATDYGADNSYSSAPIKNKYINNQVRVTFGMRLF